MNISRIELFRHSLPLVQALEVSGRSFVFRSGLLLRLTDDQGHVGVGEAAPLPGYSPETLEDVLAQAETLTDLAGQAVPSGLEALDGGFEAWLGARSLAPSLRFAIESAVLGLLATERGMPLRRLISADARDRVPVMGLLNGNLGEIRKKAQYLQGAGYNAVKLKVGRYDLADDVQTVAWLHRTFASAVTLRLDANRAWKYDAAVSFARQTEDCEVVYIEEPIDEPDRFAEFAQESGMDVALDESLRDLPPEALQAQPDIIALVLKPTVLGLETSVRLARRGLELNMNPTISSSFESGLGLGVLAQMAAALQRENTSAGIDTYEWFDADVYSDRLPLRSSAIDLAAFDADLPPIAYDRLQKI
ncbi:MAG: o-succinylbenzoate synthase [FCB group bacterium]|nr:o-succinylbenzoate synthase [FCB group bacterium]